MRLSLLQMCFGKHIERKHCCFFAGSILDEVLQVLHHVRVTPVLGRPYKVTDELFDLSTMAMEYFKEHIEPGLPDLVYFTKSFLNFSSECPSGLRESPHAPPRSMPPTFPPFQRAPTKTRRRRTTHTRQRSPRHRTWCCARASARSNRA